MPRTAWEDGERVVYPRAVRPTWLVVLGVTMTCAACGDEGPAVLRVWASPAPTAIVFQDAAGGDVPHTVVYVEEQAVIYDARGAASVTAGWYDDLGVRSLTTMRGVGDGDEVLLRPYPGPGASIAPAEGPRMTLTFPPQLQSFEHVVITSCQRIFSTGFEPTELVFDPRCHRDGTFDVLITAADARGLVAIEARDQPIVDGGRLHLDDWQPGATLVMNVLSSPPDVASVSLRHATVFGDFAVAESFAFELPAAPVVGRSMPMLRAGDGSMRWLRTRGQGVDGLGDLAVVELTRDRSLAWTVDLATLQPPRPVEVVASGDTLSWSRVGPAADLRVLERFDGARATWLLIEPDDSAPTSVRPVLPATFDVLAPTSFSEGTVHLLAFDQLDGFEDAKVGAQRLFELFQPERVDGLRGLVPLRGTDAFHGSQN